MDLKELFSRYYVSKYIVYKICGTITLAVLIAIIYRILNLYLFKDKKLENIENTSNNNLNNKQKDKVFKKRKISVLKNVNYLDKIEYINKCISFKKDTYEIIRKSCTTK